MATPGGTDECDICTELLKNPRVLDCDHVFCLDCLEKLERRKRITCPQCRKDTEITPGLHVKHLPRRVPQKSKALQIDTCDLSLVKTWKVDTHVSVVIIDDDNKLLYISQIKPGQATSIYTFTGRLVDEIKDSFNSSSPKLALDTRRGLLVYADMIYIRSFDGNGTLAGDVKCPEIKHLVAIGYQSRDDRYLLADDEAHCLYFYCPNQEKVTKTVPVEEARLADDGGRNLFLYASKNPDHSLIVTVDYEKGLVKLYDGEGTFIKSYGGTGKGFGKLTRPSGVCVDDEGRIVVTDRGNERIVRICPDAVNEADEWEVLLNTAPLKLGFPGTLDVTSDGLMVVHFAKADGPNQIAVFTGYR